MYKSGKKRFQYTPESNAKNPAAPTNERISHFLAVVDFFSIKQITNFQATVEPGYRIMSKIHLKSPYSQPLLTNAASN